LSNYRRPFAIIVFQFFNGTLHNSLGTNTSSSARRVSTDFGEFNDHLLLDPTRLASSRPAIRLSKEGYLRCLSSNNAPTQAAVLLPLSKRSSLFLCSVSVTSALPQNLRQNLSVCRFITLSSQQPSCECIYAHNRPSRRLFLNANRQITFHFLNMTPPSHTYHLLRQRGSHHASCVLDR
jgi:hypothetical protein